MYNTSLRILNDSFEAEDVMQESFLAAFTKLHTFSKTVTFGAWLKRIVINTAITKYRESKHLYFNEEILPCGDQTEIGEKGINLSDGQMA